jgi:hypothetical protein
MMKCLCTLAAYGSIVVCAMDGNFDILQATQCASMAHCSLCDYLWWLRIVLLVDFLATFRPCVDDCVTFPFFGVQGQSNPLWFGWFLFEHCHFRWMILSQ